MNFDQLIFTQADGIARICLNAPESFNAITGDMVTQLNAALDICDSDPSVRVVILSGAGKSFCAGGDLKNMNRIMETSGQSAFADGFRRDMKLVGDAARRIRRLRVPVIAAVHGPAAGAGCNIALQCDFKIAAQGTKFIEAFVNVGLIPDSGGAYILSRYLPLSRLNEALMLGKPITAEEALDAGLINQIVPQEEMEAAATELALKLKAMPALSLAKIKQLINLSLFTGLDTELEAEEAFQNQCALSSDFREGVQAFAEKRKPNFISEEQK